MSALPPFQRHSRTSLEAAIEALPLRNRGQRLVAEALFAHPSGLTDIELQGKTGLNPSTQRPRRIELCDAGLVVDSGIRRRTPSGRKAVVWKLA